MRIAVVGGGPGGLYFSALRKRLHPEDEITVWEQNAADDVFGFGVVFSDETLGGIEHGDEAIYQKMAAEFAYWESIDVHFHGEKITSSGHNFAAMGRRRLLQIMQERCEGLGVMIHFSTKAPDVDELAAQYDLVIGADGLNSKIRQRYADTFQPSLDVRECKYMWAATDLVFDAFKFFILDTPHGPMQIHGYPYSDKESTFIVEMRTDVWERAGFAKIADLTLPPGQSDYPSIAKVKDYFADVLGGHEVLANNSKWVNFTTVRNEVWNHENVVILGDAAHTAHFSIGSGTKLAMEDALSLVACMEEQPGIEAALKAYDDERRPVVLSTQRAAQASLEWFENLGQYLDQETDQFAFNLITRSRRVTYDNLKMRDEDFMYRMDVAFAEREKRRGNSPGDIRPPMFHPYRLGGLELVNRVVVSAMDMYSAVDGMPNDFHYVHLGGKALGGAGLVMTEMVCVSPEGRITPGCTGMWTDEQAASWRRVADFVHERSRAKIGMQLGHSGRKGSTKLMWEGIDEPLDADNWEVVGPSPLPYKAGVNQVPREISRAEMDEIRDQFVAAARRADQAGFDLVEIHCAHGYLLSSFISPLTNKRTDEYGGDLAGRMRYPLEVIAAVREVWPANKPLTVRISATDWADGGIDAEDSVAVAQLLKDAGVDAVDVSTGQVVSEERPAFGRSYQTPFADAIRNRVDIPTIAVGVISSYDDVNSLIMAGRADLCALGRVHLYDPNWTLHAAVEQDYDGPGAVWPDPWKAGRRKPRTGRTDGPKPRLELVAQNKK